MKKSSAEKKNGKISGFAVTGFILSLLSLISFKINFVCILFLILAVIFNTIGIKKSSRKSLAIVGLVISIIVALILISGLASSQGPKPPYGPFSGPSGHLWYDTEGFTLGDCLKICEIPYYSNDSNLSNCQTTCNNLTENATALNNYVLEVRVIAKKEFAKTNPLYGLM